MSYYYEHVIICDQLAFDRMVDAWRQRRWYDKCVLCRPDYTWKTTIKNGNGADSAVYLTYTTMNHGPRMDEVADWMNDELGLDSMHFALWTMEECDAEWHRCGSFLPKEAVSPGVLLRTFEENDDVNHAEENGAPEGYTEYEYCYIYVNTNIWEDVEVDYTREDGIDLNSPIDELLREISARLESMEELLECLVVRGRE